MKKSSIGKVGTSFTEQLIGGAIGGGVNAVFDKFVADKLPNSIGGVPVSPLVKVVAGVGIPMLMKGNKIVENGATALLACGMSDLIKKVAFGEVSTSAGDATAGVNGITFVGNAKRVPFPLYSEKTIEDPKPAKPLNVG